ncbi:MAG: MASE3 domain-containing protein, partial [Granulosicoccaceae bacterium]
MLNLLPSLNFDWRRWVAPVLMSLVLVLASQHNFLLFHTLAELFAITVAVLLAIVAWHTYSFSNNHYLMYLGVGYFWIGILDLLHTLSYPGMNLLVGIDTNTTTQFWIVTRFLEAALLLSAPLFLSRRIDRGATMTFFALNSLLISVLIFSGHAPIMFVEGIGLTAVKVYSEYAIIGLLVVAAVITLRLRKLLEQHIVLMIVLSIAFTIAAELCFTLYTHLQGVQLVAGHLFKLFSYWVIFNAIVQTALKQPYEIMARTSGSYDAIPTPTLVVNRDGLIQQVNREACRAAGRQAIDLLEQDCHDVFHSKRVAKDDCAVCQHITRGQALHDHEMQKQDASWWAFALSPFDAQQHSDLMVHVCSDISDRKHAEQSLIHQANYDSLTQLPNRELVMDRLKQAIERAKRDNKHVAVMFIDMDNFKNINDTLGHLVGDRVLIAVANVLETSISAPDTLARWGGDEFIVILGELDSLSMARPVADKILRQLASPVHADNREFIISASIGISGFPENSDDPGILLRNADAAMYLAKDAGRNTMRYYTADINAQAVARMEMQGHLRHAIEKNELSLHYQPQVRMHDKMLIGAEALLRWNNPILGNVPPDVFIPLAESSGLIVP